MKLFSRKCRAFTLIELLVTIAIIGLLITLAAPEFDRIMARARSVVCMSNLRNIGVAVGSYVSDNGGKMPFINNANYPVYDDEEDTDGTTEPITMLEAFSPYGITERVLHCPEDSTYFAKDGTSYEWRPIIDGETKISPRTLSRRGGLAVRDAWRITIVSDTDRGVHFGRANRLKADGQVVMVSK